VINWVQNQLHDRKEKIMEWLNVGSLVLGLFAWILPVIGILIARKRRLNFWSLTTLSLLACAIAIFFQMLSNQHLIDIDDMSALLDTSKAVIVVSGILLIVTAILNAINVGINHKKI
jgi:cytochrome c oxidase subunit 4